MEAVQLKYSKYEGYKDSGVEWLGEIPEEWKLVANKYIFRLNKIQVGKKSNNYDLLSLTLNGIIKRVLEDGGKFPAEFDTYQEVKKGDFVFCLFDVEETPRTIGLSKYDGMITGAYTVMQVNDSFDRGFLYYFYLNLDAKKRLKPLYRGLRNTIPKESFFSFKTFIPPLEEQTAIANFLDNKTAKIDTAIAQKEKMIALLKERKQIMIQNAVTKGLNPNAKMKDSGVEWIGEIPEGWSVLVMNHAINKVGDVDHYMPPTRESGVPYIMTGDLKEFASEINFDSCKKVSQRDYYNLSKKIKSSKGDVILARYATIGTASYIDIDLDFLVSYSCVTIKPNVSRLLGVYLFYYFKSNSFAIGIKNQVNTNTQGNVGIEDLKKVKLVLPSLNEQSQIVTHIETQSSKIDKAISLQQTQIDKLKEYKAVLIDSAVTGKIKVC